MLPVNEKRRGSPKASQGRTSSKVLTGRSRSAPKSLEASRTTSPKIRLPITAPASAKEIRQKKNSESGIPKAERASKAKITERSVVREDSFIDFVRRNVSGTFRGVGVCCLTFQLLKIESVDFLQPRIKNCQKT